MGQNKKATKRYSRGGDTYNITNISLFSWSNSGHQDRSVHKSTVKDNHSMRMTKIRKDQDAASSSTGSNSNQSGFNVRQILSWLLAAAAIAGVAILAWMTISDVNSIMHIDTDVNTVVENDVKVKIPMADAENVQMASISGISTHRKE